MEQREITIVKGGRQTPFSRGILAQTLAQAGAAVTLAAFVEIYNGRGTPENLGGWRLSGIFRDVYLYAYGDPHLADFFIYADYDPETTEGFLKIEAQVKSLGGAPKAP